MGDKLYIYTSANAYIAMYYARSVTMRSVNVMVKNTQPRLVALEGRKAQLQEYVTGRWHLYYYERL